MISTKDTYPLFDLFVDGEVIDLFTKETIRYAKNKGNHNFQRTSQEMRVFLGILIASGYCTVPRRRLCWSSEPDTHNELIASLM